MTPRATDTPTPAPLSEQLTPAAYVVLDLLTTTAKPHRFPRRLRTHLRELAALGLIDHHPAPGHPGWDEAWATTRAPAALHQTIRVNTR